MQTVRPETLFPIRRVRDALVFLKNFIISPRIEVGDYTYYHDFEGAQHFEKKNVLYLHDWLKDKLVIGKFCSIAMGTRFLMNSANHKTDLISTYPFAIMDPVWQELCETPFFVKGDTIVGNDVWFGYESLILPGVKIGNGAVIGARSVVTKDVAPYTIVAGNPARIIRQRFDAETIAHLEKIQWWNWSVEKITENVNIILSADIERLLNVP